MAKLTRQVLVVILVSVLMFGLFGCDKIFRSSGYSVVRVSDGDTLALTDADGGKVSVRFACVDAPEIPHTTKEKNSRRSSDINQFKWGTKAQQRVQQLIKVGDRVNLNITDTDRYGRKIAEVRLPNGTFIQETLASEGLALVYRPYLKNCPSSQSVQQAEALAQSRRRGVWSDAKFREPWEYRKAGK